MYECSGGNTQERIHKMATREQMTDYIERLLQDLDVPHKRNGFCFEIEDSTSAISVTEAECVEMKSDYLTLENMLRIMNRFNEEFDYETDWNCGSLIVLRKTRTVEEEILTAIEVILKNHGIKATKVSVHIE